MSGGLTISLVSQESKNIEEKKKIEGEAGVE